MSTYAPYNYYDKQTMYQPPVTSNESKTSLYTQLVGSLICSMHRTIDIQVKVCVHTMDMSMSEEKLNLCS